MLAALRLRYTLPALLAFCRLVPASYYDQAEEAWNLNANKTATDPLDYGVHWPNHSYHPSPANWRMPFYSFFLDRFVNGDPTNDNANNTSWEHDLLGTQLRHGGDLRGVVDSLDYLHGLGVRGLYLAGSIMLNFPWEADGYSPLDHTILDHHFGTLQEVREAVQAIHDRGMYVIIDNTMATMSDLFAFRGYFNSSAPWSFNEHEMLYKTERHYRDFSHSNVFHTFCGHRFPTFYDQAGHLIQDENTTQMVGCMDSEFDQFGEVGAFGVYPEWQKQLSKFNGVQDRLRDWNPAVLDKIKHFSCMMIHGLDIDGFRIDKAMQVTIEAQANFSHYIRECATQVGKHNFFIPGEIVNGNQNGAVYIGRGKSPDMYVDNLTLILTANNTRTLRADGYSALDAGAFHYTTYRALMRVLGLDGNLLASHDAPVNFADQWAEMLRTNDFSNAYTGLFDPRHMYGSSNQDVLRWPGLSNGTQRQLLADFIVTLLMPGIPMVNWGEEQAFYTLDSTAGNYVYGRQSMSSAQAWQMHGCYKVGTINLNDAPFNSSLTACQDDAVSLDHRDPSHPVYGLRKQMFELRRRYAVLNDGWTLLQLSNHTFNYTLPGSFGVPTETGLYSVVRSAWSGVQDLTSQGMFGDQPVWLLYSNYNVSTTYKSDCRNSNTAILAPFSAGSVVKNLFYPFDEWKLSHLPVPHKRISQAKSCLTQINMTTYGWKAFVPTDKWSKPSPVITRFSPGHDARILSPTSADKPAVIDIELRFSSDMDCTSVSHSISVSSRTESHEQALLDIDSIVCGSIEPQFEADYYGPSPSIWSFRATLSNVFDGIHKITVTNVTDNEGTMSTGSTDHFLLRVGQADNVMVFPFSANYSDDLLLSQAEPKVSRSGLYIRHTAAGADKWRYSLSFGASWSDWLDYVPGNTTVSHQDSTRFTKSTWAGQHVQVQYWSALAGSSDHQQEGDLSGANGSPRRYPHIFIHGDFNEYGYDSGTPNQMRQLANGTWTFDFMTEWPTQFQLNVWGMAADCTPDVSFAFGDVDNDTVLDRINPTSLQAAVVNITNLGPPAPFLAWRILFDDGSMKYFLVPVGSCWHQLTIWLLLALTPLVTSACGVAVYVRLFYDVKLNRSGLSADRSLWHLAFSSQADKRRDTAGDSAATISSISSSSSATASTSSLGEGSLVATSNITDRRRTVLIATLEYDIPDWDIKVKIGGLGVMAQLMGKHLDHADLIWVVPCVGGMSYPCDTPGLPICVTVLDMTYEVQVQYHTTNTVTYVLCDAPIFRRQTQKEPYPARMDDLDSAIYYSVWNQCIAEVIGRFPIDLYHINDYHGTLAPLHLLPNIIPCSLSLHNADFQGLWPMRTAQEINEMCGIFNMSRTLVRRYVQFGEVFNLLHAGASILRLHQQGFGAVGVSRKYGKRSWARYPIFWGIRRVGALPNPDPADIAAWDRTEKKDLEIEIDLEFEATRATARLQAQDWAQLRLDATADLFVFVGRWSMQKGIDLIADVFPAILEKYKTAQLLCVGPPIDLYGKLAALKLATMMVKYPGRVCSKPEFTALPPFVFSGAEFALIPSRDEPFGLVAVEFGRKGALGVGSRVGGLGQMPGWWYTIESATSQHHIQQFKAAIDAALGSDYRTRALMRARSARQRFPVAQWKENLEILHTKCIRIHQKYKSRTSSRRLDSEVSSLTSSSRIAYSPSAWLTRGRRQVLPVQSDSMLSASNGTSTPTTTTSLSQVTTRLSNSSAVSVCSGLTSVDEPPMPPVDRTPTQSVTCRVSECDASQRSASELPDGAGTTASASDVSIASSEGVLSLPSSGGASSGSRFHPALLDSARASLDNMATTRSLADRSIQHHTFTDSDGHLARQYAEMLSSLNGKSSQQELRIERYITKAEKQWYDDQRKAQLARRPMASQHTMSGAASSQDSIRSEASSSGSLLSPDCSRHRGIRRLLSYKIRDWPLYSILLALGQILAANSYQITLLVGERGQSATQLYIIASIYLFSTVVWWCLFRRLKCIHVMALPWLFYGLAFCLLAVGPYVSTSASQAWLNNAAASMYAIASASGSLFFAQNFGDHGAAPVESWTFRACAIQGTQQIYLVGLWFWGGEVSRLNRRGVVISTLNGRAWLKTAICMPVAVLLWSVGLMLFFGLPSYYRQRPGAMPSFYTSIFRRKIIMWFFFATFIQNFFLSAPYGRTWAYLWSSQHAPAWTVVVLIFIFFVLCWTAMLCIFGHLSKTHSWIIPIYAVSLGAPRWAQIWWSVSNIGAYLPWAGGPLASALAGRALWLWLGVLDSIQGVGTGMLLMQTLTRFHISFVLMAAQVVGSVTTIIARADGLSSIGPLPYFPSPAAGAKDVVQSPAFWTCMCFQILVCAGYLAFFRKEQLGKP